MYTVCFVLVLLCPMAMAAVGILWRFKTPAFQSKGLVYRTELTEKSPEVWEFAHIHCGKLWLRFGLILLVISVLLMKFLAGSYQKFILWLLCGQMLVMCITVFMIEILVKNLFDENGVRIR